MTKYYVSDNKKILIIDKPNKLLAAQAFKDYFDAKDIVVSSRVCVNEQGFLNNHPIDTDSVFHV